MSRLAYRNGLSFQQAPPPTGRDWLAFAVIAFGSLVLGLFMVALVLGTAWLVIVIASDILRRLT